MYTLEREFKAIVNTVRFNERISPKFNRNLQFKKVQSILNYAAENSPAYKNWLSEVDISLSKFEDFRRIPVLTKNKLRTALSSGQMKPPNFGKNDLVCGSTTGSTGHPMTIFFDRRCSRIHNNGLSRVFHRLGIRSNHRVMKVWRKKPKTKKELNLIKNGYLYIIYIEDLESGSYSELRSIIENIATFNPHVIRGYASGLYELFKILKNDINRLKDLKLIISSAEYLSSAVWDFIESASGKKVINLYGGTEAPLIALSSEITRNMTLCEDRYFVEVLDEDGTPTIPGKTGLITITDLYSRATPLIRYQIGDLAVIPDTFYDYTDQERFVIAVEGRSNDIFFLPSGEKIFTHVWYIIFREENWIDQFQVVQRGDLSVDIYIKPYFMNYPKFSALRILVEKKFKNLKFSWHIVEKINTNGQRKFSAVKSEVGLGYNGLNK